MSAEQVRKTVGVLQALHDDLPKAIRIIEGLLQQNVQMHESLNQENQMLRQKLQANQEISQKLRESEASRRKELEGELKGRESDKLNQVALETKLRQAEEKIASLKQQKEKAMLETAEAKASSKIGEEQISNIMEKNNQLQRELSESQQVVADVRQNATNRQTLLIEQEKELAAQTDTAQTAKNAANVEVQELKLELEKLKANIRSFKGLVTSSAGIDDQTRQNLQSAISTSERKPDGLKHKIKF